ncbi:MAG: ACP S-malonyltransferase [Planctomycetes bacterium]|nr:ACP S-malonyltransferase [Planctomycetota bacterium]
MSEPLVIVCPGQGAQAVGMGRAWAAVSPEARAVFQAADLALGDRLGAALTKLCLDGPAERLNRTDVSQPAIYTASIACWRGLTAAWGLGEGDAVLAATAGLSLGEYSALHVAGAFTFEEGLELVALRGRAMQDAAEATTSGMVALIGADEEQAMRVCDEARGDGVLVCANFNAPGQVVISGDRAACARAVKVASEKGLRATDLPVAGAFHSPLMQSAADRLAEALEQTEITTPRCPVMSNVTAQPHEDSAQSIRRRLVEQLTSPVLWGNSCEWLASNTTGVWHELAPGSSLKGLMRRIDRSIKVQTHDEPESEA